MTQQLLPSETADLFLAKFQRLALLNGEATPHPQKKWMACIFVTGLLSYIR